MITNEDYYNFKRLIGYKAYILHKEYSRYYEQEDLESIGWIAFDMLKNSYSDIKNIKFRSYVIGYLKSRMVDVIREETRSRNKYHFYIYPINDVIKKGSYNSLFYLYEQRFLEVQSKILSQFSKRNQDIYNLYYQKCKNQKEIAKKYGVTHSAISQVLFKINEKIDRGIHKEMEPLLWV